MINIGNVRGGITSDSTDITEIRQKYYKQHYIDIFNNLDAVGKFLERHKLLKLI